MFSLEELQNKKASLKKRAAAESTPGTAEPIDTRVAANSLSRLTPSTPTQGNDVKTNIPLPTLSLQTLASARVGLHRVSTVKSPTSKRNAAESPRDEVALQGFAKRKQLFENQKSHTNKSVNRWLYFTLPKVIDHLM
jgi:hypothetical protein